MPDDYELVRHAQEGNMLAFEQLVSRYDRQVLSIAASFLRNAEDAKDIHQEVFLRVYRALPKFEFRSAFSTWLHRITTNVCLTYRSKRQKEMHASLDDRFETEEGSISLADTLADRADTGQHTRNSEITRHMEEAINSLSPRQKLVFSLRHYEGYKLREIASMMSCAEGTVKKYLFTATERLRDRLKEVY